MDDRYEHDDEPAGAPTKKSSGSGSQASGSGLQSVDAAKAFDVIKKLVLGAGDTEPAVIPPGKTMFFELQYNFAAALCYFPLALSILAPALWLYSEPRDNAYLRFHSIQGLILIGGMFIFWTVIGTLTGILDMIPFLGIFSVLINLLSLFVSFSFLIMTVKQMLAVYKGKRGRLPIIADFADRFV
jgi:Predicted membrane protein